MKCLHPGCKKNAEIEIKITKGRLVQSFGTCLEHSTAAKVMLESLTKEDSAKC